MPSLSLLAGSSDDNTSDLSFSAVAATRDGFSLVKAGIRSLIFLPLFYMRSSTTTMTSTAATTIVFFAFYTIGYQECCRTKIGQN